jgi:phosphoribosylanthranilate isomerase
MYVKTQIYLNHPDDAEMACNAGADLIGLVCDGFKLMPVSLSYEDARLVFSRVPQNIMRVSLTIAREVEQVLTMINNIKPDVVHLAATNPMAVDDVLRIRQIAPNVKIMQTIIMNFGDPIKQAQAYQPVSDYFLLDTCNPNAKDIGATGETHDWNLSAALVRSVQTPVILAGGLAPENVGEAIDIVKPWGVDTYSQTNVDRAYGRKDQQRVREFIEIAHGNHR